MRNEIVKVVESEIPKVKKRTQKIRMKMTSAPRDQDLIQEPSNFLSFFPKPEFLAH